MTGLNVGDPPHVAGFFLRSGRWEFLPQRPLGLTRSLFVFVFFRVTDALPREIADDSQRENDQGNDEQRVGQPFLKVRFHVEPTSLLV